MSNLDVAKTFWSNFNDGDLKSSITAKLQSFPDTENCFRNGDIHFDIEVDLKDFQKVCHTLENTEECKLYPKTIIIMITISLTMFMGDH